MVLSSVVLPTPLRPIRQTSSPGPHLEVDAPEHLGLAVGGVEPANGQHRRRLAPPPEVDLEDPRVALDLLHRPLAEDRALVEHGHLAGDLPDELHVVLDDQHRSVGRDRLEQLAGARRLLVGHAGHRLVHEQQLRILRDHHPDLEPLLLAVRQSARPASRPRPASCTVSRVARDPVALLAPVRSAERGEHALAGPAKRQLHVVPHREVHEHRRRLELAADAEARDLVLAQRQRGRCSWPKITRPALGLDPPGDDVEQAWSCRRRSGRSPRAARGGP